MQFQIIFRHELKMEMIEPIGTKKKYDWENEIIISALWKLAQVFTNEQVINEYNKRLLVKSANFAK